MVLWCVSPRSYPVRWIAPNASPSNSTRFTRKAPLAKCQEVTAHLFFQPDWHTLNAALKAGSPAGVFDDELTEDAFKQRRKAQRAIACRELGGVDPESKSPATPKT